MSILVVTQTNIKKICITITTKEKTNQLCVMKIKIIESIYKLLLTPIFIRYVHFILLNDAQKKVFICHLYIVIIIIISR